MADISSTIPYLLAKPSGDAVETIIQAQSEKQFTGLMRLYHSTGENLVALFLEGTQKKLYRSLGKNMEVAPRNSWGQTMAHTGSSISFLNTSLEVLRVMQVAYEAPASLIDQGKLPVTDLAEAVQKWVADPAPSIVHLLGETVNKMYVISGYSSPVFEELTFIEDEVHFSISAASFPSFLPPGEYHFTRYVSDNQLDIWQEYELRFAFNPLMRMLVTRFSELAGRILTERLCEQLSTQITNMGWKINITTNGVTNHQFFESLEQARGIYLEIVRNFNALASPAIGPRMAAGFARDILLKLNPHHRALLQRHIYDLYGLESAAARTGGMLR